MNLKDKIKLVSKDLTMTNNKVNCKSDSDLYPIIREAHNGAMPSNFIFDTVYALLCDVLAYDFETLEDLQDELSGIADGLVDCYNSDLNKWASDFSEYVDDAQEQGLICQNASHFERLRAGQYQHIESIANTLFNEINDLDYDDLDDDEE
jgi:hypothetical protein